MKLKDEVKIVNKNSTRYGQTGTVAAIDGNRVAVRFTPASAAIWLSVASVQAMTQQIATKESQKERKMYIVVGDDSKDPFQSRSDLLDRFDGDDTQIQFFESVQHLIDYDPESIKDTLENWNNVYVIESSTSGMEVYKLERSVITVTKLL